MPATICPKCGSKNAYENQLLNYSSVTCSDCGYREEPRQMFPYTQEDFDADQEILDAIYGGGDDGW